MTTIPNGMNADPEYIAWVESRPEVIRKMIARFPPDVVYLLKSSGHRVWIYSYSEDETLTVSVLKRYNPRIVFERNVFGIKPEDLEPIGAE